LLERVVQLRRRRKSVEVEAEAAKAEAATDEGEKAGTGHGEIKALEERIARLETVVEGLQDAVHRESVRRGKQIEGLEAKTEPGEITRALSRDARERGI
jgi:uncharacterized coiled-coil DUF342 family protein